jgi:hypothetical protein
MRTLRAAAAALAIAVAVMTGQARAEPPEGAEPATAQTVPTSLPETASVVAGAVLLQAALVGMALLILLPNLRRRGAAVPSAALPRAPRR